MSDIVYFVQAACKSDNVNLLLINKYFMDKEIVALVVVIADVAICYLLFFSFQLLRVMQLRMNAEINDTIVKA